MKDNNIKSISSRISRQFPEVAGSKPKIKTQNHKGAKSGLQTYLLTFQGKAKTADGKSINRIVRVIADETGKIIKITTSR
jgi:hypothetical protein